MRTSIGFCDAYIMVSEVHGGVVGDVTTLRLKGVWMA